MLALVVDGSMMWERRQLQNGADAATLALAQDCASKRATCDPATPGLKQLADANTADGFGGIQRVCAVGTFVGADKFTITADGKPGAAASKGCKDLLPSLIGTVVYIPIFTSVDGRGSNTSYAVDGVSAFYLAGYSFPSTDEDGFEPTDPSGTSTQSCAKKEDCLWGWFVSPVIPVDAIPNTGTDRGPQRLSTIG